MPPKTNSKAAAGRARKAEQTDKKAVEASAKAEAAEAARWEDGAKGKSAADMKREKAEEAARKKAEKERLLAEEEASLPKQQKLAPKAGGKKGGKGTSGAASSSGFDDMISSLSASNIDDAIDAIDLATEKTWDKAAMGSKAAQIDSHPERRFKAAFEAYKERETPNVKKEHPGLRKTQVDDILYKQFQKAPENPFNQLTVAYDAGKTEKMAALQATREETAKRLGS